MSTLNSSLFYKAALLAAAKNPDITGFGNAADNGRWRSAYWQSVVAPFVSAASKMPLEKCWEEYNR